jgi:hypothetical protein
MYPPASGDADQTTDFLLPSSAKITEFRNKKRKEVELANLLLGLEWELCSLACHCE